MVYFLVQWKPKKFVWTSPESPCSAQCGPGIKTETTVTCIHHSKEEVTCEQNIVRSDCNERKCPENMSEWSEWSVCSKECIKEVTEQSVKTRYRTCDPSPCEFCSIEVVPCEVPICKPTCPSFSVQKIIPDPNEPNRMKATFQVEKTKTLFGNIIGQEIHLIPLSHFELDKIPPLKWNKTELETNVSKSIDGLYRRHAYRPRIRVISQILYDEIGTFRTNSSQMIHECPGAEFTCSLWTCLNGSGTIPANAVCNGIYDCSDRSDERKELCMGYHESRNYILAVISAVVGIGFFLYTSKYIFL